jgi:hypothetical protein
VGANWFTLQRSKLDEHVLSGCEIVWVAPEQCLVLPLIDIIIGETEAIARERQHYVNELVQTEASTAQMSGHIAADLSRFPPDQPLADVQIEAGPRDSLDVILQGTQAEGLTLRAARRFATRELCPQLARAPKRAADVAGGHAACSAASGHYAARPPARLRSTLCGSQ